MLQLVFLEAEQNREQIQNRNLKMLAVWENTVLKANVQVVETGIIYIDEDAVLALCKNTQLCNIKITFYLF